MNWFCTDLSLYSTSSCHDAVFSFSLSFLCPSGLAGCRGLVLVLCDLRQQDRILLAVGEEDRPPPAKLTARWTASIGE